MSSNSKLIGTAVAAAFLASTLQVPTVAKAKDNNNSQGKKLEVSTAPMSVLERKYCELKSQVDRLLDPSSHFGFPWSKEPFGWHSTLGEDSFSKKIEQLAGNALWSSAHWGNYTPRMETTETDKVVKITAEVPGIDDSDLDVSVKGDTITIKGKKEDSVSSGDETKRAAEKHYATFERTLRLPYQMDSDKAAATLKNGVLTVVVPKLSGQQSEGRKLAIRKE